MSPFEVAWAFITKQWEDVEWEDNASAPDVHGWAPAPLPQPRQPILTPEEIERLMRDFAPRPGPIRR